MRSWTTSGPRFWPLIEPAGRLPTRLSFFNLIEAYLLRSLRVPHRVNLIEEYLARVEWDDRMLPVKLYPFVPGADYSVGSIAIDPRIAFGRPVVARTGVSTAAIAGRIDASEPASEVAVDYDLTVEEVQEAVNYERAVRYSPPRSFI